MAYRLGSIERAILEKRIAETSDAVSGNILSAKLRVKRQGGERRIFLELKKQYRRDLVELQRFQQPVKITMNDIDSQHRLIEPEAPVGEELKQG